MRGERLTEVAESVPLYEVGKLIVIAHPFFLLWLLLHPHHNGRCPLTLICVAEHFDGEPL